MADVPSARHHPYGSPQRSHLQHTHLFASDIAATIDFFARWFDGVVAWDGRFAGGRSVCMTIGIGAIRAATWSITSACRWSSRNGTAIPWRCATTGSMFPTVDPVGCAAMKGIARRSGERA